MKSRKRISKISIKDIRSEAFMQSPIPMNIVTEDGTYIESNNAALKYMGLERKDVIGRKSTDLGYVTKEQRELYIQTIKEQGFAKHIPVELKVDDKIVHVLFDVYQIKIGKNCFFLSAISDVCNHKTNIKTIDDDIFRKLNIKDIKFIKGKLRNYKLTSRQQEIVLLSLKGYSNLEVAETLYLSPHTVKDHLKEVFHIIGVRSRSQLFPKLLNMK
jgi:PAS domain S-box-containing protein